MQDQFDAETWAVLSAALGGYNVEDMKLTGSKYVFGEGADTDVIVLIRNPSYTALHSRGWFIGGSGEEGCDLFDSFKHHDNNVNLIVVNDPQYFMLWQRSAEAAKYLHNRGFLLRKGDVHAIHGIVMDGSGWKFEQAIRDY